MKQYLGLILLVLGIGLFAGVWYMKSQYSQQIRTFSPYTLLTSSWDKYKTRFINQDGRVIDYAQAAITTSEGQSYAMLQAVWMDDKQTFDHVWTWTKDNLKRPNDNLFGWRWGERGSNEYGLLDNGGDNSASDADSDIALALILATRRWRHHEYQQEALPILADLWKLNTDEAQSKRYLAAGNWAFDNERIIVNPSYFAPYAWRIFAEVDTERDWNSLIDPAYELLLASSKTNLGAGEPVGLPPNWIAISKQDGTLSAANLVGLTTDYSFDAIRVPWRIALDYLWNKESKAADYLATFEHLKRVYSETGMLPSGFSHDGTALTQVENPAMYSTALAYFIVHDPTLSHQVYQDKIIRLYSNDTNSFRDDLPYYEENWLWFGAALYQGYLISFE